MKYKSFLFSALLAGTAALSTQAVAGGAIGGNCCADLEERVAELEATTVRKGNRKVSLQISGNVHRALIVSERYGDDLMITDTAQSQTKFRLVGKARISADLYAGYRIEFGVNEGENGGADGWAQGDVLSLRHNDLFIGSKTFGQINIGQGSTASDYSAEVDLSGTQYVSGGSLSHYATAGNIDGFSRKERIMYTSPSIAGFKVSASWQDNEDWDAAISYGGAIGDFTVAAKAAYFEENAGGDGYAASASILHRPTGISLTGAIGDADTATALFADAAQVGDADGSYEFWYVKAGIKRKLIGAGATAFAVDYHNYDDGYTDKIGLHLVQDIDAAAMKVYISAWDADSDNDAFDDTAVMAGATINF